MYERKQRIKDLLAQGKTLPTELREEARKGAKDLVLDEAQAGASHLCVSYSTGWSSRAIKVDQSAGWDEAERQIPNHTSTTSMPKSVPTIPKLSSPPHDPPLHD